MGFIEINNGRHMKAKREPFISQWTFDERWVVIKGLSTLLLIIKICVHSSNIQPPPQSFECFLFATGKNWIWNTSGTVVVIWKSVYKRKKGELIPRRIDWILCFCSEMVTILIADCKQEKTMKIKGKRHPKKKS